LIFVLGASLLNAIDTASKHQEIQRRVDAANPFNDLYMHGVAFSDAKIAAVAAENQYARLNTLALERQVLILTVAGVAWYLVAASGATKP
jgi:hypothetical protein